MSLREVGRSISNRMRVQAWTITSFIVSIVAIMAASAFVAPTWFDPPCFSMTGTTDDSSYAVRDPISISGNDQFTLANGVVSGDGTESNPFIIQGWEIDAGGHDKDGIVIANTDVHFILRDCQVKYGDNGIRLTNCTNCTIDGNSCSDSWRGIFALLCCGITITDNDCHGQVVGNILLSHSDKNLVCDNVCSFSSLDDGIVLYDSDNNSLEDNVCSTNDQFGISLDGSSCNNSICGNQMRDNYEYGISVSVSCSNNTIWNNTFVDNNEAGDNYIVNCAQAFDEGNDNRWNSSGTPHGYGNYWSDWTSPDVDADGIVDGPYVLDPLRGIEDSYPLTLTTFAPGTDESADSPSSMAGIAVVAVVIVAVFIVVVFLALRSSGGRSANPPVSLQIGSMPQQTSVPSDGTQRFCSRCGNSIVPGAVWCPKCGTRF